MPSRHKEMVKRWAPIFVGINERLKKKEFVGDVSFDSTPLTVLEKTMIASEFDYVMDQCACNKEVKKLKPVLNALLRYWLLRLLVW